MMDFHVVIFFKPQISLLVAFFKIRDLYMYLLTHTYSLLVMNIEQFHTVHTYKSNKLIAVVKTYNKAH